ncbi:MAG: class I SAM-dependent methyltransferase [Caldilineaceae bacterium]|nr:class I SAM-dependent methyltransferase [Caldilineaceae bacterium]
MDMQTAWNQISAYLTDEGLQPDRCEMYGPWSPPEEELGLLGNVAGRDILEIGCGAGQCSIALARQGARVTGLDISPNQLAVARDNARHARADITWLQSRAEQMIELTDATFDLILAAYVLPYVADLPKAFREMARVLRPGGRLIATLDHPLRTIFYDEEDEEPVGFPQRSYFDRRPLRWPYSGADVMLASRHLPLADWLDLGRAAGLELARVVEPTPPQDLLDELWPEDDSRAPLRLLPQAVIFIMRKPRLGTDTRTRPGTDAG